jgi:hypothetical protein
LFGQCGIFVIFHFINKIWDNCVHERFLVTVPLCEELYQIKRIHLNKVLQTFSTAQPSSSVAKHKLLRDTKKQQDVITSNRAINDVVKNY